MSRAISLSAAFFAGARVAGQLTYIPAHFKNGKQINARVIIPVYCNSHRGHDQKTGEEGRSDTFKFVAWNKLADTCCKSLPPGKAIDVDTKPGSYLGKLFNQNGTLRTDSAGQAIEIPKVAFTIKDIVFGEESKKAIDQEIATGRRPINWNNQSHPDYQLWQQILTARQAVVWDGHSATFGYARVVIPQGPGIQLDFSQSAGRQMGSPVQGNMVPNGNLPGMVANAFGGTPPAAPASPTPMFDQYTGRPLQAQAPMTPSFPVNTGFPSAAPAVPQTPANPGFPTSGYAPAAPAQAVGTALF